MNFNVSEKMSKLYNNNKALFSSVVIYGALLFIKKQFGLSIPGISFIEKEPEPEKNEQNSYTILTSPTNSIEESICSLWRAALSSPSTTTKESCARQIVRIITVLDQVEEKTVSYAVRALGKIAESTASTYTKETIANYILSINQHAKIVKPEKTDAD